MANNNRRRLRNYLLRPRLQFRYAVVFFFLSTAGAGVVQLVSYLTVQRVIERILREAGDSSAALVPVIDVAMRTELLRAMWVLPLLGIATLILTAVVLHRFIGPLVPIGRHIRKLADGDYEAQSRLRAKDELKDVADELNNLSATLKARHGSDSAEGQSSDPEELHSSDPEDLHSGDSEEPPLAPTGTEGFSLVEVLVILGVIMVIGMLGVAQFITAYDRARQRGSLADMRTIAAANGAHSVDKGDYADTFADLTPYYLGVVPPIDRWGFAWSYQHTSGDYTLTSQGSDGLSGPAAPAGWDGDPFECDLVLSNGAFMQAPAIN